MKKAIRLRGLFASKLLILSGGEGGGRTHTLSEQRQILSLVRLPVPPLRLGTFQHLSTARKYRLEVRIGSHPCPTRSGGQRLSTQQLKKWPEFAQFALIFNFPDEPADRMRLPGARTPALDCYVMQIAIRDLYRLCTFAHPAKIEIQ